MSGSVLTYIDHAYATEVGSPGVHNLPDAVFPHDLLDNVATVVNELYAPRIYGRDLDSFEVASSGKLILVAYDKVIYDLTYDKVTGKATQTTRTDTFEVTTPSGNTSLQIAKDGTATLNAETSTTITTPVLTLNGDIVLTGTLKSASNSSTGQDGFIVGDERIFLKGPEDPKKSETSILFKQPALGNFGPQKVNGVLGKVAQSCGQGLVIDAVPDDLMADPDAQGSDLYKRSLIYHVNKGMSYMTRHIARNNPATFIEPEPFWDITGGSLRLSHNLSTDKGIAYGMRINDKYQLEFVMYRYHPTTMETTSRVVGTYGGDDPTTWDLAPLAAPHWIGAAFVDTDPVDPWRTYVRVDEIKTATFTTQHDLSLQDTPHELKPILYTYVGDEPGVSISGNVLSFKPTTSGLKELTVRAFYETDRVSLHNDKIVRFEVFPAASIVIAEALSQYVKSQSSTAVAVAVPTGTSLPPLEIKPPATTSTGPGSPDPYTYEFIVTSVSTNPGIAYTSSSGGTNVTGALVADETGSVIPSESLVIMRVTNTVTGVVQDVGPIRVLIESP